jgi:uncharacterized membrane protein
MSIVPAIGATCLGIVIGYLVRYFVRRFKNYTPKALSSVVSIILGGGVVKFLSTDQLAWWFYPIGLLIGFMVYSIIGTVVYGSRVEGLWYTRPRGLLAYFLKIGVLIGVWIYLYLRFSR